MRTDKNKDQFLREVAKKKPHLQELLNTVHNMSATDIDNLSEPLWIRQALHMIQNVPITDPTSPQYAGLIDRVMAHTKIFLANLDDTKYEIRQWLGIESTLTYVRGQFIIDKVQDFLMIPNNVVLYDTAHLPMTDQMLAKFKTQTTSIGMATIVEYRDMQRHKRNGTMKDTVVEEKVGHGGNDKLRTLSSGATIRITSSDIKGL